MNACVSVWLSALGVHTFYTRTHQMLSLCYYFKSCELNNRHNRQHIQCSFAWSANGACCSLHTILVLLFKLAIIDENSSIALNICAWSALLHYVWMYLFVHLSAGWLACSLTCMLMQSYIRMFVHWVLRS